MDDAAGVPAVERGEAVANARAAAFAGMPVGWVQAVDSYSAIRDLPADQGPGVALTLDAAAYNTPEGAGVRAMNFYTGFAAAYQTAPFDQHGITSNMGSGVCTVVALSSASHCATDC